MRVWITKYALSAGIQEREAEPCDGQPNMIEVKGAPNAFNKYFHSEGKDWHRTREAAIKRANEMRANKVRGLQHQLNKLADLTFE